MSPPPPSMPPPALSMWQDGWTYAALVLFVILLALAGWRIVRPATRELLVGPTTAAPFAGAKK